MRMGVIESGDSGKVVLTQETSGTESDDSAEEDLNTSLFIETNPPEMQLKRPQPG